MLLCSVVNKASFPKKSPGSHVKQLPFSRESPSFPENGTKALMRLNSREVEAKMPNILDIIQQIVSFLHV